MEDIRNKVLGFVQVALELAGGSGWMMCREIYVCGVSLGKQICESAQRGCGTRAMRQRRGRGAQPRPWEMSKEEEEGLMSPEESAESRGLTRNLTAGAAGAWREQEHLAVNLGEMQCCSYHWLLLQGVDLGGS